MCDRMEEFSYTSPPETWPLLTVIGYKECDVMTAAINILKTGDIRYYVTYQKDKTFRTLIHLMNEDTTGRFLDGYKGLRQYLKTRFYLTRTTQIRSLQNDPIPGAKYVLVTAWWCDFCTKLVEKQGWSNENVDSVVLHRTKHNIQVLCITTTKNNPWQDIAGIETKGFTPSLFKLSESRWVETSEHLDILREKKLEWES